MTDKIILGTAQFGFNYGINNKYGKPSKKQVFKIFDYALKNNITTLDTAEAYGDCYSLIREYKKLNPSINFKIYSKLDIRNVSETKTLEENIMTSLRSLKHEYFEGYMFHSYNSFKKYNFLYDELINARKKGIIKKIGISLYSNGEIMDIVKNYNEFDFIQAPFNLLDNKVKREKEFKKLIKKNIEIQVRSVFLQGLFFKAPKDFPSKLQLLIPYIKTLKGIANTSKIDIKTLALKYVINKDYIKQIVIGIDNLTQLEKNLKIFNQEVDILNEKIDSINVKEELLLNPSYWN